MASKGGLLFDLNELPTENEDDIDSVVCFQPQKALPSKSIAKTDAASARPQRIVNNQALSHSSPVHGLQPFAQTKPAQASELSAQIRGSGVNYSSIASSTRNKKINFKGVKASPDLQPGSVGAQDSEKEEGEWSDAEESANACRSFIDESSHASEKHVQERGQVALMEASACPGGVESTALDTDNIKNKSISSRVKDPETTDKKSIRSKDGEKGSGSEPKPKVIRGSEANHALRSVNIEKRPKPDQRKEVMLGKKRKRQTMFLDLQDVKQAGPLNTSTPRKQIPAPSRSWTAKETHPPRPSADSGEKQAQPVIPDMKQGDQVSDEGKSFVDSNDNKTESDENSHSGTPGPSGMLNSSADLSSEVQLPVVSRQSSWKHPSNSKQLNQLSGRKTTVSNYSSTDPKLAAKRLTAKKQSFVNPYQDSSVERLLREVTSEKLWNHTGNLRFPVCF